MHIISNFKIKNVFIIIKKFSGTSIAQTSLIQVLDNSKEFLGLIHYNLYIQFSL